MFSLIWFVFVKPSFVLLYVLFNVKFWKTLRMLKQLRQFAVSTQNAEGMQVMTHTRPLLTTKLYAKLMHTMTSMSQQFTSRFFKR